MKTSNEMIEQIRSLNNPTTRAYEDADFVVTIGVGHKGSDVSMGDIISTEELERMFKCDILAAEGIVNRFIDRFNIRLEQKHFDALVSFVFGCGAVSLRTESIMSGTLIRKGLYDTLNVVHAFMNGCVRTLPNGKRKFIDAFAYRRAAEAAWYVYGKDWEKELKIRKITDVVKWAKD